MFTPLKGKDHTKAYLKDKEYRSNFKAYTQIKLQEYTELLSNIQTCTIHTNSFIYILTPSFYDKKYQLTMFSSKMIPLSHRTYDTISDLVNDRDNSFLYLQTPIIEEYKEAN